MSAKKSGQELYDELIKMCQSRCIVVKEDIPKEELENDAQNASNIIDFSGLPVEDGVKMYLKEIGNRPLLSIYEETLLAKKLKK